jgi:hypothetical protein
MIKRLLFVSAALVLLCSAGCNKTAATNPDETAIRAALQTYLASRPGLNVSAMETNVKQVIVTGNTAQAKVEFKAKGSGAGMEMTYNLERLNGAWAVKTSQNTGGLSHPPIDQGAAPASGSDALPSNHPQVTTPAQSGGVLPAGHPPISDPGKTTPPPKK